MTTRRPALRALARFYGVATCYVDAHGNQIVTSPATLARMIDSLAGKPVLHTGHTEKLCKAALQNMRREKIARGLPPVLVTWEGKLKALWAWLPEQLGEVAITITPEDGEALTRVQPVTKGRRNLHGHRRVQLKLPAKIPYGYYTIQIGEAEAFLISAPQRLKNNDRSWGLFAPTYALRSASDQGIGDFRELQQAAAFVKKHGGDFLGTLPLLPGLYEGKNINPSPYSPLSRLFCNEIFLDLRALPGVEVDALVEGLDDLFESARKDDVVDYAEIYRVKKRVISDAAEEFFNKHSGGDKGFKSFSADTPELQAYAEQRAEGVATDKEKEVRFHLYAQYACHVQLTALKKSAKDGTCAELYLDYPVGVHPDGFDAKRFAHLFLNDFNVGAPPDMFFSGGQDWGFRPLSPQALLADRFRYFRASIHHYFRYARMLRLDHVMGLYRIYCVPHGDGAAKGSYIYYPFDAMLAVLNLEAHRHDGVLIGEDLGTVPDAVSVGMKAHGLNRMWIFYFQLGNDAAKAFRTIEPDMIASLNTHDMFPFTSFLKSDDIRELQRLGLMNAAHGKEMTKSRDKQLKAWKKMPEPFLTALTGLAASPARYVQIGAEDLWAETKPQNVPGTVDQYPNWRRKFRHSIEEWDGLPSVKATLDVLNDGRKAKTKRNAA